jgi:hypothetical protein
MKRILLSSIILLPFVAAGQQKDPSLVMNRPPAASSTQEIASLRSDEDSSADASTAEDVSATEDASAAEDSSTNDAGSNAEPSGAQAQAQSTKVSTPAPQPGPRIPGSMVGYIDNPIVENQIRIRFDDAFEDQFPDRAEFIYSKCGCYRGLPPTAAPFDPKAPGPGPAPGIPVAVNFQQLYLNGEYAPHRRFSAFVEIPIRWLQPQGNLITPGTAAFPNSSGIGDVMAGFKFAAVASESTYLTFQFKSYFPSGDSSQGLGTNHYSVEPSLLLYHSLSPRFTLEGQLGDWHPIGGSAGVPTTSSEGFAGDIFFYGIGPSYKLYNGSRFKIAPVVELFGWHVLSGFQTQLGGAVDGVATDASGTNIVNLKVGVRVGVGTHSSVYVGFGQALTHDDWYKHLVRLEYRFTF